jgi:hypothetical protein
MLPLFSAHWYPVTCHPATREFIPSPYIKKQGGTAPAGAKIIDEYRDLIILNGSEKSRRAHGYTS